MKKLYYLVALVISFATQAQIINIPDANFKAKLLSANSGNNIASTQTPNSNGVVYNYNVIDINNNGEIEQSEADLIKYLDLYGASISDLTGSESFTNLITLKCNTNQLTVLNISPNQNLLHLNCAYNQLTNLNITQNPDLLSISCNNNLLTSLDVTQQTNLYYLNFYHNQLTTINVSQNPLLISLLCAYNQLTTLDVTNNSNLSMLECVYNELISMFIKNNNISWNYYGFNFHGNPNLQYICADEEDIALVQQKMIGISNCHVNSYCSFVPNGTFYTIHGNNKWDSDDNGCNPQDINYPNVKFNITNGNYLGTIISDISGNYSVPVQAGSHTITPVIENPTYFNISPSSFIASFPTQTSPLNQDFCITPNGIHHDVEVIILPINPARPGFDANYTITYKNKANQIENGVVTLNFDDAVLDLVSANPTFSSQGTNSMSWNYTNLQPFETRTIDFAFNVNNPTETPAVNIGDQLNYTATITPMITDEYQFDNSSTLKQIVVGSYDPNDKTCIEGTTVGPDMIGQYVHYVIRFENTGTYAAENVVVKDMIDLAKFDVNTLIPLHSSHDFVTRIKGNKVEFIFEGINLPFDDANNDGYVAFKIKTKSNLIVGNTFSNNASIYFDYNFPIITNTYTTTIAALSTTDFDFGTHFTLYPNPVREVLNFQSKDNTTINSIEIYNALGQIVLAVPNTISTVDVSSLKSGNYFVKVNTDLGVSNTKFIKE